jgi:hypothetical protein
LLDSIVRKISFDIFFGKFHQGCCDFLIHEFRFMESIEKPKSYLMNMNEIKDWQFGSLRREDNSDLFKADVEWTPGLTIELWIHTDSTEFNTWIEPSRRIFDSLWDQKERFPGFVASKLLDTFNELFEDSDKKPVDPYPIDAQSFIDHIALNGIEIYTNGESILTYLTFGGPLIRVTVSPDLNFRDAVFD